LLECGIRIFISISIWLGKVASLALCFLVFNILIGYQMIIEDEEHELELAPEAPQDDAWPKEAHEPPHLEVLEEVPVRSHAAWYELVPPAHVAWIAPVPPAQDAWYAAAPPTPDAWGFVPAAPDYQPGEGSSSQ
jgi:hypothetical protein